MFLKKIRTRWVVAPTCNPLRTLHASEQDSKSRPRVASRMSFFIEPSGHAALSGVSAAAALPGAAAPLRADTAPSLDIHLWAHSHQKMTTTHPCPATLAVAHLAAGTAPGCSRASGAWRGLHPCRPVQDGGLGCEGFSFSWHGRQAHMPGCGATNTTET